MSAAAAVAVITPAVSLAIGESGLDAERRPRREARPLFASSFSWCCSEGDATADERLARSAERVLAAVDTATGVDRSAAAELDIVPRTP